MMNEFFSLIIGTVFGLGAFFAVVYRMKWKKHHLMELQAESRRVNALAEHPRLPFEKSEAHRQEELIAR